ncbi:hypothetical protein [Ureibacillus chungkukjangi]|uniref:Ig-like domain-containing protein n=1 Tax=Ureibacillus chungkukjangi TaxID=1202712 RepID=A0A318TRV4_9BACL|nr:hypothetical protein [Ureibacillus chungkukjangi]PYF07571.1 hypothetical protein BJ095_10479 [Ureibacillus chungkukjangi]
MLCKVGAESAINAKTLKVEFNNAVATADQAKATFDVKRGSSNVSLTAKWNADGKSVELSSSANLLAGDYTVAVNGLSEKALTGTTTVKAVKATSLDVASTVLYDATAEAPVNVSLKDQYGEELTLNNSDFTKTAYNKTQGKSVTLGFNGTDKAYYVNTSANENDFKVDDVITVTFIHNETGLTVTKELKVVAASTLDAITFGNVELPKDKTILTSNLTDVKVAYTAKDQYGEEVVIDPSDVEIVTSDASILAKNDVSFVTEEKVNKVKIAKFGKEGTVTLTLLSKASGKTATVTLDVKQAPGAISEVILGTSELTVAANSTAHVGVTVKDNYGTEIKPADYVSGKFNVTSSNPSVVAANAVGIVNTTGDNYGKISVAVAGNAQKGATSTITVTDAITGKTYGSFVVTAGEVAVPTTIDVAKTSKHASKLAVGAETTVTFTTLDQYGNAAVLGDFTTNYKIKGTADNFTVTKTSPTTAKIEADKVGTAVVVAELKNAAGDVVASKEVSLEVVANSSEAGLAISDIATLAAVDPADEDAVLASAYKEAVKVKTADGVALPSSSIISVTSSNPAVAMVALDVDGNYYVAGKAATTDASGKVIDAKATITVVYNATDKPVTLTKEVTVSATPVAVSEISVVDKAQTAIDTDLTEDAEQVPTITVANFDALSDVELFPVVKDNFGRYQGATLASNPAVFTDVQISIQNAKGFVDVDGDDTITLGSDDELVFTTFEDNLINSTDGKASFRILLTNGSKVQFVDVTVNGGTTVAQAAAAAVTAATDAVVTAETSKSQADVDAAQALVTALPTDVAPATTKADLQDRLAAITVTP